MIVGFIALGAVMIMAGVVLGVMAATLDEGAIVVPCFTFLAAGIVVFILGLGSEDSACGAGYEQVTLDKTITIGEYKIPAGWEGCVKL